MVEQKKVSLAQTERQTTRKAGGQYRTMNRCECCGKGCGADYYTIEWFDDADWPGGVGQTLHEKCCVKLQKMGKDAARAALLAK